MNRFAPKQLTPKSAQAIATVAYVFAFPLVMRYSQMYRQSIDPCSPTFSGGFATWREDRVTEPRTSGTGRPREDVLYASTWLDLRVEPWWCSVEAAASHVSFRGALIDLWGFRIVDLEPGDSGRVLASAPADLRNVPSQVRIVARGESSVVQLSTETRWTDPYRLPGTYPERPPIVLAPVSSQFGRSVPRRSDAVAWSLWFEGLETTDEFWSCANFALSLIAPDPDDRHVFEQIAHIGVVPGEQWSASAFSGPVVEAIRDGMDEAVSDLLEAAARPDVHRRDLGSRSAMDRDYFSRALAALRRHGHADA